MRKLSLLTLALCFVLAMMIPAALAQTTETPSPTEDAPMEEPAEGTMETPGMSLAGTQWELVAFGDVDGERPVLEETNLTLAFDEEGFVSGNGGCNGFGGNYTADSEGALSISEIISTMMACADDDATQQESIYLSALQSAMSYEITDEQLIIHYGEATSLIFEQAGLQGSEWVLVSWGAAGEETPLIEDSTITLSFMEENQAGGNGGCNTYSTTYTLGEENALSFSDVVSTRMACADEAITQQEQDYFAALQGATSYEIAGDTLTIWTEDSQLNYERDAMDELVGTEWQLTSYGVPGEETTVMGQVTIAFQSENQVSGNGGCNSYGGQYRIDGDMITFSEVISTLMACADADITQQEQDYLSALQATTQYAVAEDQLTIWYGDGLQLNFVPVAESI
ncbi:META domain-containing protein [Phototrophicus methaneseepsis]|uniref:META domain-containing protein n=1 Tax=Phototrophicus methaneseepsis TaxID=2710758 RepID=A0A7S8EBG1_9CHLR|nr:META domain-containing protein [Phototrophicus methaneseepsis]QPC83898.1 META domain-containing protein [Phototrophicus methaneseepsis]